MIHDPTVHQPNPRKAPERRVAEAIGSAALEPGVRSCLP